MSLRVSAALDYYFEKKIAPKKTDYPRVAGHKIANLKAVFGKRLVSTIGVVDGEKYLRSRKGMSPATVRGELALLIAAANYAVKAKKLPAGDVPHLHLPDASPTKERFLSRDEARLLLRDARKTDEKAFLFIAVGLHTGARPNVIEHLEWDRIDFNEQTIDFRKNRGTGKKKYGIVKIAVELMPILAMAYARRDTAYVLGQPKGMAYRFSAACKRVGIENVTPNTMRHTWATWAAQDGIPLWQIAGVLGNSMGTVEKKYAHHHPSFQSAAMGRVVLGGEFAEGLA